MKTAIIKVQVAITPPDAPALVYAHGRKRACTMNLPGHVRLAMGDDLRAFFHAQWDGDGWIIGARVADEAW